jgi:hypothetical protein
MFDLIILLYVASTIASLFFASDQPTLSLAAAYASYAVTLIMRPAGSAIFGNLAGRRQRSRYTLKSGGFYRCSDLGLCGRGPA